MNENRIIQQLDKYIDYMHSLGFKLKHKETVLRNFARFTPKNNYSGPLTLEIILKWISEGNMSNKTMGRKVEVIRPFSKYVAVFDCEVEPIYSLIYKNVHDRPTPYTYTEDEVIRLIAECQTLYSSDGICAKTTAVIIGLLWSAGLRPSEDAFFYTTSGKPLYFFQLRSILGAISCSAANWFNSFSSRRSSSTTCVLNSGVKVLLFFI